MKATGWQQDTCVPVLLVSCCLCHPVASTMFLLLSKYFNVAQGVHMYGRRQKKCNKELKCYKYNTLTFRTVLWKNTDSMCRLNACSEICTLCIVLSAGWYHTGYVYIQSCTYTRTAHIPYHAVRTYVHVLFIRNRTYVHVCTQVPLKLSKGTCFLLNI